MKQITLADFAGYFTVEPEAVPEEIAADLTNINTRYRETNKEELEEYFDYFIKKVTKRTARRTDEANQEIFERGWAENLEYTQKKLDSEAIRPKYYQNLPPYYPGPDGRVYFCENRNMPVDMLDLYVKYLFLSLFSGFETIHEFGSGSGQNLLTMAGVPIPPPRKLVGYDWTDSGVRLADMIGEKTGRDVKGRHFDMLEPDYSVDIQGQAVLTVLAIEQLADRTEAFLEFLLAKKPRLVVNIEPDSGLKVGDSMYSNLSDLYLSLRGQSQNYYQALRKQETAGRLTIKQAHPLPWLFSFSNIVLSIWRPL
jgi:hypothetical protein